MSGINYWKQFEHTGKIEDYLSYSSFMNAENKNGIDRTGKDNRAATAGVNPYAGIHMGNGNNIETDAYRGI